ncbi:hypothetical protein AVEN_49169-1 [Araneus ventricosus]|uniref:Uncharacterized protein n=1 Tax=Araneus ventricosus TaxID=182803 RepID=A0A4Y2BZN2_ARAVE|nr:hypothetical protein AVEN_49169-1 [Araneus ventricosus]
MYYKFGNLYPNHLDLTRSRSVHLNDSCCDSLSAEAGVLMAITGHGPTPPVGGTPYERQWASLSHYYLSGGFSSTDSWCPPAGLQIWKV